MTFDPAKTVPVFFDLATSTGWAARDIEGGIHWGSFSLAEFKTLGGFLYRFDVEAMKVVSQFRANLITFEEAFVKPPRFNKRTHKMDAGTSNQVAKKLMGLGGHIQYIGARERIPAHSESRLDVLRFFLGTYPDTREEQKLACIKMCKLRGWTVANDDEADALAGLDLVCHRLKMKNTNAGPLFSTASVTVI